MQPMTYVFPQLLKKAGDVFKWKVYHYEIMYSFHDDHINKSESFLLVFIKIYSIFLHWENKFTFTKVQTVKVMLALFVGCLSSTKLPNSEEVTPPLRSKPRTATDTPWG